ncbi:MAG TPA: hypothetical protein VKE74_30245 [Gemmataceae bacterium]|nr:hypothetical protein [Gemmataceae bacterium]
MIGNDDEPASNGKPHGAAGDRSRPRPRKRLSPDRVAEAIGQYHGNLAAVARSFGVSRAAVGDYVARRPELQAILYDAREERLDNAESSLDRAILRGEGWAVTLLLRTLGKNRGYYERTELTGGLRMEIVEEIVDAPDPDDQPSPAHDPLPDPV